MNHRLKNINSYTINRYKTIKLLEGNTGEKLDGYGDDFLDIILKAWSMKETISYLIKVKNFFYERQCQENEKIDHRLGENFLQKTQRKKAKYLIAYLQKL